MHAAHLAIQLLGTKQLVNQLADLPGGQGNAILNNWPNRLVVVCGHASGAA